MAEEITFRKGVFNGKVGRRKDSVVRLGGLAELRRTKFQMFPL